MPHGGGTISLAPSPCTLVRLAFHDGEEHRLESLCYVDWCSRKDFAAPAAGPSLLRSSLMCAIAHSARLQPPRSKRGALYIELREQKSGGRRA